ncbi:LamG domain-containing protein [Candidatus Daviesbacteria bacterium]|nr:LamG domain-containing protein [Candidatus Daviesbacteria bacterium]
MDDQTQESIASAVPPVQPLKPSYGKKNWKKLIFIICVTVFLLLLGFISYRILGVSTLPAVEFKQANNPPSVGTNPSSPPPVVRSLPQKTGVFSDLSANLFSDKAIFQFSYDGSSVEYDVVMSTDPTFQLDVAPGIDQGSLVSPIVVESILQWDRYVCGKDIYWKLKNFGGTTINESAVQKATIRCNPAPASMGRTKSAQESVGCDSQTIALWKFEEATKSAALVNSCNSTPVAGAPNGIYPGTPVGTNSVIGKFGRAQIIRNSGVVSSEGNYIDFGPVDVVENIKTIEMWVKFDSLSDGQVIISKSLNRKGLELLLDEGQLKFTVAGDNGASSIGVAYSQLNTSEFFHIAATQNGPNTDMKLYLNGKLVSQGQTPVTIRDAAQVMVGISPLNQDSSSINNSPNQKVLDNRFFNGIVDELRLSRIARTASEINKDYLAGK